MVLGGSYARGLAKELKYRLNHEFEIEGIKHGSTVENLVKMTCSNLKTLTKRDVCLLWGGTNDFGKNETNMDICVLNVFVSSHEHTSAIVLNIPHRHDLAPNLCANYELTMLNRKLGRKRKVHKNLSVITVDFDRGFT
jgi:hypothetical protein